ncbi:MAG: extracellular solute-binding protein [Oscillospiraceae bacterium]|jgi:ABC-type glycerol-3-phosphate transport system substrate-binding protein|nr:extracellular solute-binding protein [Oscillospiraceae bacterium]
MKNTAKTLLAILLSLSLLLSLTLGCVDKDNDNDSPPNGNDFNNNNSNSDGSNDMFVYIPEFITLPHNIGSIRNLIYSNDKIYLSTITSDTIINKYTSRLFTMNLDGSNLIELVNYSIPETNHDIIHTVYVTAMCVDADGNIWIGETQHLYRYNTPDGFDYDNVDDMINIHEYFEDISQIAYIKKFDATGRELISIDLNTLANTNDYIQITGAEVDSDGNIIISTNTSVYIFNDVGSFLFSLLHDDMIQIEGAITLSDETIAVYGSPEFKTKIQQINIQDKTWGDSISVLENTHGVVSGNGSNYFYCYNNTDLFGYDKETEDFHNVLNWVDSGLLYSHVQNITVLDDGRVLGNGRTWDYGIFSFSEELFLLTKTSSANIPDKIVLTLATFNPRNDLMDAVNEFNHKNTTYRVDIVNYYEFATNDNWRAGLTKLYLEILSGNVPDIIDVSFLPFRHLANKGLFEDLYTYIDADEVLNRSDFIESTLRVVEQNDKLYSISPSFLLFTIVGSASVLGAEIGWTIDELMAVINANPQADIPLGNSTTKIGLLYWFSLLSLNDFINWETGTTYFDSDAFIRFLEFANTFPSEEGENIESNFPPGSIFSGRQIMQWSVGTHNFMDIQRWQAFFNNDLVFKGFPTEDRSGNAFVMNVLLSISSVSEHKEGAWEFVRTMLMEEWQFINLTEFPTNKAAFSRKADFEVQSMKGGVKGTYYGISMEYFGPTQAEVDDFYALLDSMNRLLEYDDVLINIIRESAEDYFNGLRTVEEAARIIQSRASIYVSEQVG